MIATLEDVDEWKKFYLKEGHTVSSTTTYYNYIKIFIGNSNEINQKNIDAYRNKHYSTASSASLKRFFEFLVKKKGFPNDILNFHYGKNKKTRKAPAPIEPIEVQKIIDSIETLKDKYVLILMYELALRISEVLKLNWDDFNWITWLNDRTKFGKVIIKDSKRNKFRTLPVKPYIMEKLYIACARKNSLNVPMTGLVFDYKITDYIDTSQSADQNRYNYILYAQDRYRKLLYKISKQVLGKRVHPHQLRHTKAQKLMDNDMPIESLKEFLGHEDISTTEIYARSSAAKLERDIEKFDKI